MREGDLILVGADVVEEFADRVCGKVGPGHDGHRHVGDEPDGSEGGSGVVGQLAIEPDARREADMMQHQHVAVGIGPRDARGAQRAASTGNVLDDDLLPERAGHRLGDQPAYRVGGAASGERHDHRDRSFGIVRLGQGTARQGSKRRRRKKHPAYHLKPLW
jgi:hypothetical protein